MIIPTNRVDNPLGVHLQRIYKTGPVTGTDRPNRADVAAISRFSTLVERGREAALSVPDLRADRVEQAKAALRNGDLAGSSDLASAMINSILEGQV